MQSNVHRGFKGICQRWKLLQTEKRSFTSIHTVQCRLQITSSISPSHSKLFVFTYRLPLIHYMKKKTVSTLLLQIRKGQTEYRLRLATMAKRRKKDSHCKRKETKTKHTREINQHVCFRLQLRIRCKYFIIILCARTYLDKLNIEICNAVKHKWCAFLLNLMLFIYLFICMLSFDLTFLQHDLFRYG